MTHIQHTYALYMLMHISVTITEFVAAHKSSNQMTMSKSNYLTLHSLFCLLPYITHIHKLHIYTRNHIAFSFCLCHFPLHIFVDTKRRRWCVKEKAVYVLFIPTHRVYLDNHYPLIGENTKLSDFLGNFIEVDSDFRRVVRLESVLSPSIWKLKYISLRKSEKTSMQLP